MICFFFVSVKVSLLCNYWFLPNPLGLAVSNNGELHNVVGASLNKETTYFSAVTVCYLDISELCGIVPRNATPRNSL
jgi:hypothetical protein